MEKNVVLDETSLFYKDDEGKEAVLRIILTFDNEETGKQYVIVEDPDDDSLARVFRYDETSLYELEDEKEWEMAEEVLQAYDSYEQEQ